MQKLHRLIFFFPQRSNGNGPIFEDTQKNHLILIQLGQKSGERNHIDISIPTVESLLL